MRILVSQYAILNNHVKIALSSAEEGLAHIHGRLIQGKVRTDKVTCSRSFQTSA